MITLILSVSLRLLCGHVLGASGRHFRQSNARYPFSVDAVQKALQSIGGFGGGKLPVLDGFVTATDLDRYDHPYFQYRVHLKSVDANNTLVSVEAKISALIRESGSVPSRISGTSLKWKAGIRSTRPPAAGTARSAGISNRITQEQTKFASQTPTGGSRLGQSRPRGTTAQAQLDAILAERQSVREKAASLQTQLDQMAASDHDPANAAKIGSVKHSGVGVMSRQNFGGPVLFRAQAEDEFEIIDLQSGWAQVRLGSGFHRIHSIRRTESSVWIFRRSPPILRLRSRPLKPHPHSPILAFP